MKNTLGLLTSTIVFALLALAGTPNQAAAQGCDWCTIDFCGGTSVCGHGCNSRDGAYPLEDCSASVEGCEGEEYWADEELLPDMSPVALVRNCQLSADAPVVVADIWRGLHAPATETALNSDVAEAFIAEKY